MKTLIALSLLISAHAALADGTAASKTSEVDSPPKASAPTSDSFPAPPYSGADRVLWETWYTVTLKSPGSPAAVHYGYYNDRLELKKGKLYYKQDYWKKEEGFVNEEHLGAVALNDEALEPVVYNFHSNYRSIETDIDGSASGHLMTIVIQKAGQKQPPLKKAFPPRAFFEVFFPVWIGYHADRLKTTPITFQTMLENNIDAGFDTVSGTVKLEGLDDVAKQTSTRRLAVSYGSIKSTWWVDRAGLAKRIEIPEQGAVVERSTKAVAEKFLE